MKNSTNKTLVRLAKRAYLSTANWIEEMRPPRPPKTHVKFVYSDTPHGKWCEAILAVPADDGNWWTIRHYKDGDGVSVYLNDSEFNWLTCVSGDREERWQFIPEYLHEKVRGLSNLTGHTDITGLNPSVGTPTPDGRTVYYCYPEGEECQEVEALS